MKRIIKLTESDLTRIVKRVIMEQDNKHFLEAIDRQKNKTYCVDLRGKNQNDEHSWRSYFENYGDKYSVRRTEQCQGVFLSNASQLPKM